MTKVVGEGEDSFSLTLRKPTDDELKVELQAAVETLARRLSFITGWSGVHDNDDQPIAFTDEVLTQAMRADHAFASRVSQALQAVFEDRINESTKSL